MALFLAAMIRPFQMRWRRQFLKNFLRVLSALFTNSIMRPLAGLPAFHDTRFHEYFHVIGKRRLPHLQLADEHAGTFLPLPQYFQYAKAVFIAQCAEYTGMALVNRQQKSPHIKFI
jgi:hypothetical protein